MSESIKSRTARIKRECRRSRSLPDEVDRPSDALESMPWDEVMGLPVADVVMAACVRAKAGQASDAALDDAWPAFVACARRNVSIPNGMTAPLPPEMSAAYVGLLEARRVERMPEAIDRHGRPSTMPVPVVASLSPSDVVGIPANDLDRLPPDAMLTILAAQAPSWAGTEMPKHVSQGNRNRMVTAVARCVSAGWTVPDGVLAHLTAGQLRMCGIDQGTIDRIRKRTMRERHRAAKERDAAYSKALHEADGMEMPSDADMAALTKNQRKAVRNRYRKAVERDQTRRVMEVLPCGAYKDEFPGARSRVRRFVLHVGPTNSGKTHDAIEALKTARSGTYLAPLRLLALEVGEAIRDSGVPCDIVTGEEADYDEDEGTSHVSSTVEMLDTERRYDVAVIDEAQMLDDEARGWSWTRAIVGVDADVVHVCMAQRAEGIVTRIIEMCGDEVAEVVRHERKTPLTVEPVPFDWDPRPGDALVCFSRKAVLATATNLEEQGIRASVVYGALPWQARKREAEKFRAGETQVVVATDSIGMGLNLPIRRVVFLEDRKFDGTGIRKLRTEEWKQIAGRAGRLGMYDEGFCTTTTWEGNKALRRALGGASPQVEVAYVGFPRDVATDVPLSRVMRVWGDAPISDEERGILTKQPLGNAYAAAVWMDGQAQHGKFGRNPTRDEETRMVTVPFDMGRDDEARQWCDLVESYLRGDDPLEGTPGHTWWANMPRGSELADCKMVWLEALLRQLGISYGFLRQMGRLTPADEREYAEYRGEVYAEVIRKLDGPKSLIGSYYVAYRDAEREAESQWSRM